MLGSWSRLALASALVLSSMTALGPARAHAADALVLSIGGDAPDELAREAREAAIAALTADGVAVVPEAEVALRVPPARLRALASLQDARVLAFELEARVIVGVAVWMREGSEPPAPDSVVVSLLAGARSFSATRAISEAGLAAAAGEAMRDVRQQQTRAMVIEGAGLGSEEPAPEPDDDDEEDEDAAAGAGGGTSAPSTPRGDQTPGFDIVGPTMLGAFGAAGIGLGVYAVLDGTCELRGASGICLRGEDPNVPLGVTFTIAGALALAGAVVWFVTGATVVDTTPIDIVLGPDGGMISTRGSF